MPENIDLPNPFIVAKTTPVPRFRSPKDVLAYFEGLAASERPDTFNVECEAAKRRADTPHVDGIEWVPGADGNGFFLYPEAWKKQEGYLESELPIFVRPATETLDSNKLVKNFDDAMIVLHDMFDKAENASVGGLRLDTVKVNLEVSGEGKLAFLGSGGSISGKSSFELTFKRPDSASSDS
jgi:hypothetical protein